MITERLHETKWIFRVLAILLIAVTLVSVFVMIKLHTQLYTSYEAYLNDLGSTAVKSMHQQLKNKKLILEMTADKLSSGTEYEQLLGELIDNHIFETVLFLNQNEGLSYQVSKNKTDTSYWLNTAYTLTPSQENPELSLSVPVHNLENQKYYNLLYQPVYDTEKNFSGYVVGFMPTAELYVYFSSNNADLMYDIAILSETGTILVASQDSYIKLALGENIFSLIDADSKVIDSIRTDFTSADVSKNVRFHLSDSDVYFYYYVLGKSNLIYVTYFDAAQVNTATEPVFRLALVIVLFLMLWIIASFAFILYLHYKDKRKLDQLKGDIQSLAYIDPVTEHMNWNAFTKKVKDLLKDHSTNYALLSMDINKFRAANDFLGHEAGDRILLQLADVLRRNLTQDEAFTRNNADLFYLLVKYNTDDDIFEKMNNIINDTDYQITDLKIILSFGIYRITSRSIDVRSMVDRADLARITVKHRTESTYAFFNINMLSQVREEKAIENIMEQALEKGEFKVYLQPKFDLIQANRMVGAEALVRWYRGNEIISPGKFIPLFERNRFIIKLDLYIFEEVCKQQRKWLNQGRDISIISVNMSRVHLQDKDFVIKLSDICKKYNVSPSYFEIEITESAAFENLEVLCRVFEELKQEGFHISIDDFGSGYSSLNMLKDLPVDVLKIDRAFLSGAETNNRAQEIVSHVVSLALALEMKTICEGLETKEQVELVKRVGCQMAQGYFFARPMPISDYEKLAFKLEVRE